MAQISPTKLGIPRLEPLALASASRAAGTGHRTSRACNYCRTSRSKCTGGEPCKRCSDMALECVYSARKRELDKKLIERLARENSELFRKNQLYVEMLKKLCGDPSLPETARHAVCDLLLTRTEDIQQGAQTQGSDSHTDTPRSLSPAALDETDNDSIQGADQALMPPSRLAFASEVGLMGSEAGHKEDPTVPAESWTDATSHGDLVKHLLALYFCWEYPTFANLSREHFLADFYAGRRRYCSSLLVNALLALGSRFSDFPEARKHHDNSDSAGEQFFEECKRLLAQEEVPSLPTIQALGLMSLRQASQGNDRSGWFYARQAMRMALDLDLHLGQQLSGLPESTLSSQEIEVRTATFWGCYNLEQAWCLCIGRVPQVDRHAIRLAKPAIIPEIENEDWTPYMDHRGSGPQGNQQQGQVRTVYKTFCELCELVHDTVETLYSPKKSLESKDVLSSYTKYLEWYDELPNHLRLGVNYTPTVLFTHMYYHFAVLLLFRPFMNLNFLGSSVSPQIVCIQAAESIASLVQFYRRLYTLRRTPSFMPYMTLTSDLALLVADGINCHKSRTIDPGNHVLNCIQTCEELSESHQFARTSSVIIRHFAKAWQVPLSKSLDETDTEEADASQQSFKPSFFQARANLALPMKFSRPEGVEPSFSPSDISFSLFPAQGVPLLAPTTYAKEFPFAEIKSDQVLKRQLENKGFTIS